MRYFLLAMALLWCAGFSCTRPLEGDFGFEQLGLRDDELLWVIRLDARPQHNRQAELSPEDSLRYDRYNTPIFTEALPAIVKDLLADSMPAYEDYQFVEEEKPITDLAARLYKFGISKQNFSPLLEACDLLVIARSGGGNRSFTHKFLRLVWRDPEGRLPDRNFVCIKFEDIEKRRYLLTVDGVAQPFAPILRQMNYQYVPVYLRNNNREYPIQNPEEASYIRQMVMSGNWDRVAFVDDIVNVTGYPVMPVDSATMNLFEGAYQVEKAPNGDRTTLYLTVERNYLVADWVQRSSPEKIYPYYENAYFSPRGELYLFPDEENNQQQVLFVTRGDTLRGLRFKKF